MKIIFLLIVYFVGFATGIYCLTPHSQTEQTKDTVFSALTSDEFVKSFNVAVHRFFEISKDAAVHAGQFVKQKYGEMQVAANK